MNVFSDTHVNSVSAYDDRVLASAVHKVRRHILPLLMMMFMVSYVDRVNVSFVRPQLQADLGIGAAAYGLGAGLFFLTYALVEVPSNVMLQRIGARIWLSRIMATWGLVSILMGFIHSDVQFYVVRALLGATEAGFFPGVLFYFTKWFPERERGKAVALFLSASAVASIVSGPLSGALLRLHGFDLHGWQWMFIVEGGGSIILSSFAWFRLASEPAEAPFLNGAEKAALLTKLSQEANDGGALPLEPSAAMQLFRDPQIFLFCFLYFCITLTIYAVSFWLPGIIRQLGGGLTDVDVGALNAVPWAISIAAMYVFAMLAVRWRFQQGWVAAALFIAAAGLLFSTTGSPLLAFICVCFAAIGFKAASSLFWPLPQRYFDSRILAAALALINSIGNLGGFVAPATFGVLEEYAGSIRGGLYGLAAVSIAAGIAVLFARSTPKVKRPRRTR